MRLIAVLGLAAALCAPSAVLAQAAAGSSNNAAAHAQKTQQASSSSGDHSGGIDSFPKLSFQTFGSVEFAGFAAERGPSRGPEPHLRFDSTVLLDLSDTLSIDGLFQYKPRKPLGPDDPNRELFINQGAGRPEGGKMKELYVRYGTYRFGKFVPDFGRAYALLPGPYAADFIEETDQGYEPSDMVGAEWLHVFDDEKGGWRQLTLTAFMADRTFLHQSFPYNEGMIHYKDGGVGNTRWPENLMVTYDVLNKPVGHWAQLTYQASLIRYGKSYGAQRGEVWGTAGADLAIPLNSSVASTLGGSYSQLRLYVEAARRENFNGFAGRARDYLSASAEYLRGRWLFDLTTTRRWTTDRVLPRQADELYTATIGYNFPSQTTLAVSVADEQVDNRQGLYVGLRLSQTYTTCSRCLVKGRAY